MTLLLMFSCGNVRAMSANTGMACDVTKVTIRRPATEFGSLNMPTETFLRWVNWSDFEDPMSRPHLLRNLR